MIIAGKDVIYYLCALKGNQPTERLHQQRLDLKGCRSHPPGQITPASGQHKWVWKIAESGRVKRNIQPSRIINLSDCRAASKNVMISIRDAELQGYGEREKNRLNRWSCYRDAFLASKFDPWWTFQKVFPEPWWSATRHANSNARKRERMFAVLKSSLTLCAVHVLYWKLFQHVELVNYRVSVESIITAGLYKKLHTVYKKNPFCNLLFSSNKALKPKTTLGRYMFVNILLLYMQMKHLYISIFTVCCSMWVAMRSTCVINKQLLF